MTADVCVLIESTYPYVSGGVSTWLHALIKNMPELTFSLVHIGGRSEPERKPSYQLPENVVEFFELPIFDASWTQHYHKRRQESVQAKETWEQLRTFHLGLTNGSSSSMNGAELMQRLDQSRADGVTALDLCFAPESWKLLLSLYEQHASASSFVDYLWTFRSTHLPLFSMLRASWPRAKVYHAVSSGFNGFAGALAKLQTNAPFIVTEHGLSTREREIEIAQSEWIYRGDESPYDLSRRLTHFQEWWLNMFRFMTKMTYDSADAIISITGFNQRYQLRDGADARKMLVIPNGINIERFRAAGERRAAGASDRFVVGFVGRVVSIKDVKTFIRAIRIARDAIPNLEALIVGPITEESEYARECQQLVELLGLSDTITFTGPADVCDYYPKIDVLALTSLSEAQPLVILEANCAGTAVVASEVGACRELIMGITPEDKAIGASGILTAPVSPQETANGIIHLWRNPELRKRMAHAGLERVQRYYREQDLYEAYRSVYGRYLAASPVTVER